MKSLSNEGILLREYLSRYYANNRSINRVSRPPPQIYIREWREVELTPKEWYRVLASPVGCCFYKIKYWHE